MRDRRRKDGAFSKTHLQPKLWSTQKNKKPCWIAVVVDLVWPPRGNTMHYASESPHKNTSKNACKNKFFQLQITHQRERVSNFQSMEVRLVKVATVQLEIHNKVLVYTVIHKCGQTSFIVLSLKHLMKVSKRSRACKALIKDLNDESQT